MDNKLLEILSREATDDSIQLLQVIKFFKSEHEAESAG